MSLVKALYEKAMNAHIAFPIDPKMIIIGSDAYSHVLEIISQLIHTNSILLVCDENTYVAAGIQIENICHNVDIIVKICKFPCKSHFLIPDEDAVHILESEIDPSISLLLAVGTGTIHDLTRYCAYNAQLPFISIPTAPSVDGFASSVSALIQKEMKVTVNAKPPVAIVADTNILVNSPARMKAAGFGDLIGKYIACMDWELASILTGEKMNREIAGIVIQSVERCITQFRRHNQYDPEMIVLLMEGLIVSGLAIAIVGSSRPASGSEHHVSHFLELQALQQRMEHFLHGETVSFGTMIMHQLYTRFLDHPRPHYLKQPDLQYRKLMIDAGYGPLSHDIYTKWTQTYPPENIRMARLAIIKSKWQEIQTVKKKFLPSQEVLIELFKTAAIPYQPYQFHLLLQTVRACIIGAKEVRDRYTLLSLLDELGYLDYYADDLCSDLYYNEIKSYFIFIE
jgi:glycerol-1-phosphate dehydrogenase [NAD(P)+]